MQILRRPAALPPQSALCIGAFDGLHRGHRCLLQRARDRSPRLCVLTFEPHPAAILAPDRAPPRLQSPEQRARIADALGVECLVELPFNRQVASMSAEAFIHEYLIEGLRPSAVVVGADFRFGKGAAGTPELLRTELAGVGIELEVVPQLDDPEGRKIGSSAIREHLLAGRVEDAAELLGYAHAVSGPVRHGAKRGRQLGYPTANVDAEGLRPSTGVYAGWLTLLDDSGSEGPALPAVANLGSNPTFADGPQTTTGVEVHAIGAELGESLYDQTVEFAFVHRLRDEQRFDGADALRVAIEADISEARRLLADADPTHRRPTRVEAS
jgi:riboflavin kinase/FMN adenylyltransferase